MFRRKSELSRWDLLLPGIRHWRKSCLVIDRELYKEQCKVHQFSYQEAKENYYSNITQENKGNQKVLFNTVTQLNMSIVTANVPVQLMEAMIRPKLKKESLDHEVYSNFRPTSNLKFISKMIEKAILYQLTNYLRDNDLEESLQSANKTFHSTKTALVKVHNDIVSATDNQSYIMLFYHSLICLQLLTWWITRFFCRDSLVALVLMAKPCAGLSPTLRIVNK